MTWLRPIFIAALISLSPFCTYAQEGMEPEDGVVTPEDAVLWQPLSEEMLAALRGNRSVLATAIAEGYESIWMIDESGSVSRAPESIQQGEYVIWGDVSSDDPFEEAVRLLNGLDLSGRSRDLPQACASLEALTRAVDNDLEAIRDALSFRVRAGQKMGLSNYDDPGNRSVVVVENAWDWPASSEVDDQNATHIARTRLQRAVSFESVFDHWSGVTDLLCGKGERDYLQIVPWLHTRAGQVLVDLEQAQHSDDISFEWADDVAQAGVPLNDVLPLRRADGDWPIAIPMAEVDYSGEDNSVTGTAGLTLLAREDGTLTVEPKLIYNFQFKRQLTEELPKLVHRLAVNRYLSLTLSGLQAPTSGLDLANLELSRLSLADVRLETLKLEDSTIGKVQIRDAHLGNVYAAGLEADYLTIRNMAVLTSGDELPWIDLERTQIGRITLSDLSPGLAVLRRESALEGVVARRFTVDLDETEATSVVVRGSRLAGVYAVDARIAGEIKISDTEIAVNNSDWDAISLDRSEIASVKLTDIRGPSATPANRISIQESNVRGEVSLTHVYGVGLWAPKIDAGVLRISDSEFVRVDETENRNGDINFWGAQISHSFITGTSAVNLMGWYSTIGSIEITGRTQPVKATNPSGYDKETRPAVFSDIAIKRAKIGTFLLMEAKVRNVWLADLEIDLAQFICTAVEDELDLYAAVVTSFWANRLDAGRIDLHAAQISTTQFARDPLRPPAPKMDSEGGIDTAKNPETPAQGYELDDGDAVPPEAQDHAQAAESITGWRREDAWDPLFCNDDHSPNGAFGTLDLDNLRTDRLDLTGYISKALSMNRADIGKMMFADDKAQFDKNAEWSMRGASIGSIAMPMQTLSPKVVDTPISADSPVSLDIEGAQIGVVRLYNCRKDGYLWERDKVEDDACPESDYTFFLHEQLLPALSLETNDHETQSFRGADYAFLRRSMDDAGQPHLAQRVAIMQNDHYAAQLREDGNFGLLSLYRLGGAINQYGYNNGRALLLLLALWFFGIVILLTEKVGPYFLWRTAPRRNRLFNAVPMVRKLRRKWSERWLPRARGSLRNALTGLSDSFMGQRPKTEEPEIGDLPWWESFFLSADRVVPTMGVDEDFSRPHKAKHSKVRTTNVSPFIGEQTQDGIRHRHGLVIAMLYAQRIMAFVIVLFMLGGVLDVFQ